VPDSLFSYLRSMNEDDLSHVLEIERQSYDFPWSLKGFENSLERGLNYLFCSEKDQILGYCCLLPVLDEAHILNLCVAPQFLRQGVASQAMRALMTKLADANFNIAFLEVRESNHGAISLYTQLGFNEDGARKNYYPVLQWDELKQEQLSSREDAILMSCFLTG
jgi:ribosomal-protein-alanine N-acetyltransferase